MRAACGDRVVDGQDAPGELRPDMGVESGAQARALHGIAALDGEKPRSSSRRVIAEMKKLAVSFAPIQVTTLASALPLPILRSSKMMSASSR